jgi:hypothetical protein
MPFSWVRVSSATSKRIRECTGDSDSRTTFDDCVRKIVEAEGGGVEAVWFEQNGKFARVHFFWETHEQKARILFDLEAEDVIDLITPRQADELARR